VIHWITYVRAVNLDEEFMSLPVTYPLQQALIPLRSHFLRVLRVYLSSVTYDAILWLVNVIWQHHLIDHHVFESCTFLRRACLQHLLLYYQLLLRRQLREFFLRQAAWQLRHLRHLHP
jgi:hypothetical protein